MISLKIILGQWKYIKAFNSSEKKKHFKCLISRLANEVLIFIRVRMHSHIKLNGKKIHVAHISYCFISILTLKVQSRFKRCVHSFTYAWLKEYVALCHFTAFFWYSAISLIVIPITTLFLIYVSQNMSINNLLKIVRWCHTK